MSSSIPPEELSSSAYPDHSTVVEKEVPTPNYRWMGAYLVREALAENTGTDCWRALHIVSMDEMLLIASRVAGLEREQAIAEIKTLDLENILKPIEAHTSEGRRIVVTRAPRGPSLRAWRAGLKILSPELLVSFVRTMTEILDVLHAKGIGHFNLRPENIFVENAEKEPRFVLAGWDTATLIDQKDLIAIPVDLFYAPPEAAALTKHSGGEELCTWDWWSLGRVIQELIAGQHVLGLILNRDVSIVTDELNRLAEDLLLNRSQGGYKAGAVEALSGLDKRIELILHGLLSTVREARWRSSECRLWLDGASPKEHYLLGAREHCFRWRAEAYTVSEAAESLRSDDNWEHAADQLLQADKPGSLAAFIHKFSSDSVRTKLVTATNLLTDESLQEFPPLALREVATMMALLELAGGKLIWRGRRVEGSALKENLQREDGSGQWLGTVWALTSSSVLCLMDQLDPESGRIITDIGKLANKALEKMLPYGWISRNNLPGIARVWQLACDHPSARLAARENLRRFFACSTLPEVQELFSAEKPSSEDLVIIAYMDAFPQAFGFLTHEEWARREYRRLHDKGMQTTRMLLWKNLHLALRMGPWWFGGIWWPAIAWGGFTLAFSIVRPGPLMTLAALLPAALAVLVRVILAGSMRSVLAHWMPEAQPWRWRDNPARCEREEAGFGMGYRSSADLRQQIQEINASIAGLAALNPRPSPVPAPPRFALLALTSLSSWLVLGLTVFICVWQIRISPPSWEKFKVAWDLNANPEQAAARLAIEEANRVKIPWDFRPPENARTVTPHETRPATGEEIGEAERIGKALLNQYKQETINALILVRFPTDEHYGFLIYDGRRDQIVGKNAIILLYDPMPRTWIEIEKHKVFIPPR
ncbi:MAG: hypothetical protein WC378_02365 [Opitutaceae bacterium]|jgi:serine/threonine protein kinase